MTAKSDNRLAEFLRRVLAADNDAAPVEVVFGQDSGLEVQRSAAREFASSVRDLGHVEPTGGPDGDLDRVRVTTQGREWLTAYDGNRPTLHPRYSS